MIAAETLLRSGILAAIAAPVLGLAVLAAPSILRRSWREHWVGLCAQWAFSSSFVFLLAAVFLKASLNGGPIVISLAGGWVTGGIFAFDLLVDGWSIAFAALSVAICGVVSAFSFRYLHQEPGFHRYFMLLIAFVIGLLFVSFAGSIEVLYAGWEILGFSSALLVAFFHDRPAPVANGLRVFAFYRIGDACMLASAVLLHHWAGNGSLVLLFSGEGAASALGPEHAAVIAALLIAAASAKCALLPFSTWLPRAMEGPTPSSAVYYGALSIHAGCYLLIRSWGLLAPSLPARVLLFTIGAASAVYAAFVTRVQTDVKSRLCFASLTQVGIIVVEIAFGWRILAFLHMTGNACYRSLQFLCAPNVLHDIHELENDLGGRLAPQRGLQASAPFAPYYLFALERGFLDGLIERWVSRPLERLAAGLDGFDRRLCGHRADSRPRD